MMRFIRSLTVEKSQIKTVTFYAVLLIIEFILNSNGVYLMSILLDVSIYFLRYFRLCEFGLTYRLFDPII